MAKKNEVTRRELIGGAASAVVAAGAANIALAEEAASAEDASHLWSWEAGPEEITDDMVSEVVDTDVCVVGAGIAGVSATAGAVLAGANVVCLHKLDTCEMHGGAIGIVNAKLGLDQGYYIDPVALIKQHINGAGLAVNAPLVRSYIDESGAAMDWLVDMCEQRHPGKIKWYHAHEYLPTEQYVPGSDAYPSWPGTWKREDLAEDGSWVFSGMNSTIQDLYDFGIENGADVHPQVDARQLIVDEDGKVVGVYGLKEDDTYIRVNVSKGVILCTGGFQNNAELVRAFIPGRYNVVKALTGEYPNGGYAMGQGFIMGMWAGAQNEPGPIPTMSDCTGPFGNAATLVVNANGERFTDESHTVWDMYMATIKQPGYKSWQIFDANWKDTLPHQAPGHNSYANTPEKWERLEKAMVGGVGNPDGVEDGDPRKPKHLWIAETLEELAEFTGMDAEVLKATVAHYNELCEAGEDTDFGKHPIYMDPIVTPPFIAGQNRVSATAGQVMGGLLTNKDCQCLHADGSVVEGLWCAGNVQAGRFGQIYETPVNAMSIGMALTHGMHAGRMAAEA